MAITVGSGLTALSMAGTKTPAVGVPTGAVNGDQIWSALTYAGADAITAPTGVTSVDSGAMSSGGFSVVTQPMASGLTQTQWTLATSADGVYGKSAMSSVVIKGGSTWTKGPTLNRTGAATTISDLASVTVPAGGLLLAFAGDKVSNQTTVSVVNTMTEDAKVITGGGGGISTVIAHEFPAAGASGTRRVTYGLSSGAAWGFLVAITPATGTAPPTVSDSAATVAAGTAKTLSATVTGAVSGSWAMVSGPPLAVLTPPVIANPTSATAASVTPTIGGVYVFRYTATNTAGSTSGDLTLTVTDTTTRPIAVVTNPGNFVPVGQDTIDLALADASDTTYAEVSGASGQSMEVQLSALDVRTTEILHVRCYYTGTPTGTLVFTLKRGSTVIRTQTQAISTTITTYPFTLTAAEVTALSDGKDLRLQVSVQ